MSQVNLTVQTGMIRDGTQGISLSIGQDLIGQWTDTRARTLSLTSELRVAVCGPAGDQLYLFSVPGTPLRGEQISETQVMITFELE